MTYVIEVLPLRVKYRCLFREAALKADPEYDIVRQYCQIDKRSLHSGVGLCLIQNGV